MDQVEKNFLADNEIDNVYYAIIDSSKPTYKNLIEKLTIDGNDLAHAPVLFVMEYGDGYVIKGPRAVDELKQNIKELIDHRDHKF